MQNNWHGHWDRRPVQFIKGQTSTLLQKIPEFEIIPFAVDERGFNEYLKVIVKKPLRADLGNLWPPPDQVRIPVSVVSSNSYQLVQHRDIVTALETALKQTIGDFGPECSDAELTLTKYGERMRLSYSLPDKQEYKFDPGDGGEIILLRVRALNSVDKGTPVIIELEWRGVDFLTGIPTLHGKHLKKKHLKSRTPLESRIKNFLNEALEKASSDIEKFQEWHRTEVHQITEKPTPPSPGQINDWCEKVVKKQWNQTAANDALKAIKSKAKNAYDISRILSRIANEQDTIEKQLDWSRQIPSLMQALLETEQPITLTPRTH